MPDESETMSGRPRDPEEAAKRERPRVSAFLLLVERFDERLMPGTRFQGESARASRSRNPERAGEGENIFWGPFAAHRPPPLVIVPRWPRPRSAVHAGRRRRKGRPLASLTVAKREKARHRGDKRHRRGILNVGTASSVLPASFLPSPSSP